MSSHFVQAGVAVVDITPPPGLQMSGFAARTDPASGAHDPLTIRALVVEDTAIVCADVIGLGTASCRRIREQCGLPADRVVVTALHTHGGPGTMPGQLGGVHDPAYLERLESAAVTAIDQACTQRRAVSLHVGQGMESTIAKNRRHAGGVIDPHLPVLALQEPDGSWLAVLTSYACHPVVLGSDNLEWTADYPGVVRSALEQAFPGAVAMFVTGCAGDVNTGHAARASFEPKASAERTFAAAERIGRRLAEVVATTPRREVSVPRVRAAATEIELGLVWRERDAPAELAEQWRQAAAEHPTQAGLYASWVAWAEAQTAAPGDLPSWTAPVTVLDWGGVPIVALPGEIFAQTGLGIRRALTPGAPGFVLGFANACPGYLPPESEYPYGGYEVDEAHRYYGQPGTFAPGSAEALAQTALELWREALR